MSKELKVGLIAVISGLVLYYGFNYLKGIDFFSPTNKYYAVYDKVDGLTKSNPVIINGLNVGRVGDIQLLQTDKNKILVQLDINDNIQIGSKTEAHLSNTDFLGSKGIVLTFHEPDTPIEPGDTLISIIDGSIMDALDPVTTNLTVTITRVNEILLGLKGSGEKINNSIDTLKATMSEVKKLIATINNYPVHSMLDSLGMMAGSVRRQVDNLSPVITKTSAVLDSVANLQLNSVLAKVDSVLTTLETTLNYLPSGEGTLGKLITEDTLYYNINRVMVDLDQLLIHLDQYPKDFLSPLGKKHNKLERKANEKD